MKKTPRRILIETAGRLHALEQELAALKKQRTQIDERIEQQERKLAAAASAFEAIYARAGATSGRGGSTTESEAGADEVLTAGKLPHRVLERMKRDPTKIYTAADLASELTIRDVQQVRTALARLVSKALIRRAGAKGEFTI
jgi:chromosome segregation ATPase